MGQIARCLYISRSLYHTSPVSRPYQQNWKTVFQRFFQSGEKPVIFNFTDKGQSDCYLHRGAYGLYLVGSFISFYGVYLMINCKTKKSSQ
ncbi:hypothetical protein AWC38_SpisGene15550 [Stylophora pistillata]|uniref:Uncharacterized protein n=1 Tax=Stylophora pistillata TaxID=50429 RepID=A0A2B4RT88_STYPI|nr:hypothetical protein AWC38_SpisGene15550 [Stylophora pistillata]